MPYRRLPNTDQARLRALKAVLEIAEEVSPLDLKVSQRLVMDVKAFAPQFEQGLTQYTNSRTLQAKLGANVSESSRQARLYLSHFIQVFNMCITRGEIKPDMRIMLGLEECGSSLPDLTTDKQVLDWGDKIVAGEEQRMAQSGGNRIYNPSIAVVKVKLSLLRENYNKHRDIVQTIQKHHSKLDSLRGKADALILEVWNEVEAAYAPIDSEEKRRKCAEYGVVYFYRPREKHKDFLVGKWDEFVKQG